ncbi:MAG: thiol:disulfide interchange protein DsbA/DsbL [Neisseria sp.]|nr:thiol:disulfide interchange protein DsbA/DsbL [Neisseria sp.]
MKMKQVLIAAVLAAGFAARAQAALQEGRDYTVLAKPLPQQQADKIEVTEFFGYFCVHCYHLNPILLKHAKSWPADTYLHPVHVVWSPDMEGFARITAAVNAADLKHQASPALFEAVYAKKLNLADSGEFKKWAAAQKTFDSQKLLAAYDSFSNKAQAGQMADLTAQYNIEGTPTIIVGGKYRMKLGGNWEESMKKVDEMVAQVRKERGMKIPAQTSSNVKSRGALIAKTANR